MFHAGQESSLVISLWKTYLFLKTCSLLRQDLWLIKIIQLKRRLYAMFLIKEFRSNESHSRHCLCLSQCLFCNIRMKAYVSRLCINMCGSLCVCMWACWVLTRTAASSVVHSLPAHHATKCNGGRQFTRDSLSHLAKYSPHVIKARDYSTV